ncbi:MAG: putative porin [Bacteroidota bacterium]
MMLIFYRSTLLFLIFIFPLHLFSDNNDSVKVLRKNLTTNFFDQSQFECKDSITFIESSLHNFHNYLGKNHLGNNGLPFNDLVFQSSNPIEYVGFNYCKNNFNHYFYTPQKLKFYNTRTPYSDLFYVLGSKLEQAFKMTFSYNVKKNWNVTADFNRIRSQGFYLRQNTNHNFIALSSNYKSLNNRYYFLASIIYNNAKNSENGGISNDSIFLESDNISKELLGINLNNAKRTTRNRNIYLKQYLNFGRKSTDTAINNAIIPGSRLILTSMFDDNILKYEDENPSAGYYSDIYFDSTRTFDSTFNFKIENELAWKRVDNKKHRGFVDQIGVAFSIKHQLIKIEQRELFTISDVSVIYGPVNTTQKRIDTIFNNLIAGGELYNTYSNNSFWWNLSAKYTLNGYNEGDYYAGAVVKKAINDSLNVIVLKAEHKLQSPDFIYNYYTSNHFSWNNSFEKGAETHLMAHFSMKKYNFAISASYTNYTNVLYFNDSAIAKQFIGKVPVISLFLKKDFVFYNWHLNNKINYQNLPDSTVVRLPEFVLEHSLYYENNLFNGALKLQVGASIFYTTAYYANAYMPATAQFYIQNKKKYGDYPFIDFFISGQIRTVRIFFKIDHLNNGLMGNNYMLTPGYPINDRAFKLGVSWRFFD